MKSVFAGRVAFVNVSAANGKVEIVTAQHMLKRGVPVILSPANAGRAVLVDASAASGTAKSAMAALHRVPVISRMTMDALAVPAVPVVVFVSSGRPSFVMASRLLACVIVQRPQNRPISLINVPAGRVVGVSASAANGEA